MRLRSVTPIQLMFCLIFSVLLVLLFTRFLTVREAFAPVDWRLLVFLGSFMLLADELGSAGFVEWIAREMARRARGPRGLYLLVLTSSFILAMLVTNDAALFAIVPFTLALARRTQLRLRRLVIYEIMAVNLGGLGTVVASFANLIGLSLYLNGVRDDGWKAFLGESLGWNTLLLVGLGGIFVLFIQ